MHGRARMIPVLILVALAALGFLIWRSWFATYHLATVQEGVLYRDGNRGVRELEIALQKIQPRTVVCLFDDRELNDPEKPEFAEELQLLNSRNLHVVRLPIALGGWPTSDDVRRFLDVVNLKENQPVLVHCAQGVRRTGMLVAAYQESVMGYTPEQTKRAILRFGHSERSIGDVKRFIDVYDPKAREVTKQLAMSKE